MGLPKQCTWLCFGRYKITYTGEQVAQWDFQNNAPAFVLEGTKLHILVSKLHSETFKTMHLPLVWKVQNYIYW